MAELTDDQKLAVINYVKSIEEKKEDRLFSLIRNWLAIIGVSAIAVLTGFASYLESRATDVARREVDEIAQAGKIDDAILEAYRAISSARAKGDALESDAAENLGRSKALLLELNENLVTAQGLTKEFRTAAEVQAAVNSLNSAKNDIVTAISSNPQILKTIVGDALVPKGAIAAFGQSNSAIGNCPAGWSIFEPSIGRFIVGAGLGDSKDMNGNDLTDYNVLAIGGEEKHKLKRKKCPNIVIEFPPVTASSGTTDLLVRLKKSELTGCLMTQTPQSNAMAGMAPWRMSSRRLATTTPTTPCRLS